MEHLPICATSARAHPRVPKLQGYKYDDRGFSKFPARMGFDKARLLAGDFSEHHPSATGAMLQAWLYFGLITETLGDHVRRSDFVYQDEAGRHFITTTRLPQYIENRIRQLPTTKCNPTALQVTSCLDEANMFASFLSGGLSGPTTCPLSPEIALSIMALASSIDSALWQANRNVGIEQRKRRWGCSLYLHNRMILDRWCPNDLRRLHEHGSISLMYYASTVPRTIPPGISHVGCADTRCSANFIHYETYQTKHAETCAGCGEIDGHILHAQKILDEGSFPVMKITPRHDGFDLDYVAYKPGITFCAISHVWSDGLGNKGNSLPVCQIRRLYTLAQDVLSVVGKTAQSCFLWIDTLCVPRQQPFRKLAISRISTAFAKAAAVLVLDSELLQVPSQSPVQELLIRVSCSGWMRRVWTLLEGALAAPALYVQFDGGSLGLCKSVERERKAWKERCYVTHSLESDVGIFYEDFTVMRLSYQRWSTNSTDAHALGFALHGFAGRSTSWKGDDYLCLGILMGLDGKAVEALYDTAVEDRPAALLSRVKSVPHGLLFCPGPKLSVPGLRWVPADLWSARPYMVYRPAALHAIDGIEVSYPGFLVPSFPLTGNCFLFHDRSSGVPYRATCDPKLGANFPSGESLSELGHVTGHHKFGIICPTIQLADLGPRTFDKVPAALVSVNRTTNRTKHILDIGRTAIYGTYICQLYLTVPTTEELQDSFSIYDATRAPVHVGEKIKAALRLQNLSKMKTEWLDQTWYVS